MAATTAIDFSAVLRPVREAGMGLTSWRSSYVVSCTTGTSGDHLGLGLLPDPPTLLRPLPLLPDEE